MIVFSAVALYITYLWNKGFKVNFSPYVFARTVALIALFYYIIIPLTKLVLLPINLLTLGLISSIVYFLLFYFFITRFSLVEIKPWDFPNISYGSLIIKSFHINYLANVLFSSISLSFIINLLESLL